MIGSQSGTNCRKPSSKHKSTKLVFFCDPSTLLAFEIQLIHPSLRCVNYTTTDKVLQTNRKKTNTDKGSMVVGSIKGELSLRSFQRRKILFTIYRYSQCFFERIKDRNCTFFQCFEGQRDCYSTRKIFFFAMQ